MPGAHDEQVVLPDEVANVPRGQRRHAVDPLTADEDPGAHNEAAVRLAEGQ